MSNPCFRKGKFDVSLDPKKGPPRPAKGEAKSHLNFAFFVRTFTVWLVILPAAKVCEVRSVRSTMFGYVVGGGVARCYHKGIENPVESCTGKFSGRDYDRLWGEKHCLQKWIRFLGVAFLCIKWIHFILIFQFMAQCSSYQLDFMVNWKNENIIEKLFHRAIEGYTL